MTPLSVGSEESRGFFMGFDMARPITRWKDRFDKCVEKRDRHVARWKKAGRFYKGDHWGEKITTYDDNIVINYYRTILDTIRDSVYFKNPDFIFEAEDPQFEPIAFVLNDLFPPLLRRIMYKQMTKLCVLDALRYGHAFKYNGYTLDGDMTNDAIKPDEVFSTWIPHDSVAIDYDANGLWDANYLFMEVWEGFEEVKRHPAYKIPSDFKHSGEAPAPKGTDWRDKEDAKRVRLIHIFDRGNGTHKIFTKENKSYLYSEDWPLGNLNRFPINMLRLSEDGLYPRAVGDGIIPLNEELNKMESMKITHAKRFNRKYLLKGTLDKKAKDALVEGYDGAIVEGDEDTTIEPIKDADLTHAVYASSDTLFYVIKLLVRVGEYRFGIKPKGDTTATEATFIEGGTSLGIDYSRDVISDFCEVDGEILVALMRENYDSDRMVRLKENKLIAFSNAMLEGAAFKVSVDVEGSAPPERVEERNEALALMNLFSGDPFIDPLQPRKKVLESFKTVKNINEWFNSNQSLQLISQALSQGGKDVNLDQIRGYLDDPTGNSIVQVASKWSK